MPGSVYNVVDDLPASRAEAVAFAKQLLLQTQQNPQLDIDCQAETALKSDISRDTSRRSMSGSSLANRPMAAGIDTAELQINTSIRGEKRVSNQKVKAELGVCLDFPSFIEGLTALHAGCMQPFD